MRTIIAANWKMHKDRRGAKNFASELTGRLHDGAIRRDVIIFAPFTALNATRKGLRKGPVRLGAQDVYPATEGAFTGEISPAMIKDCGATWVLTGHSERRHILGEDCGFVAGKTVFALANGLNVMLCVGETLQEREAGQLKDVLAAQLMPVAEVLKPGDCARMAIAYEPVWAIGTGKIASEGDIVEAHAIVRDLLVQYFRDNGAAMPILYGGSVKPDNSSTILKLDNVNGVLVGGASLKVEDFEAIIRA